MDRELIDRARAGDTDAFEALLVASGDRLLALAFRIMRDLDLAEDAVQAAYVRAWRDLHRLRDPDKFDAWLRRLLVNACYVLHRDVRRRAALVGTLHPAGPADDPVAGLVDRDTIDRGFRHLTIEQRAVVVYRYYLGYEVPAIAAELGIPAGTVKSRLHASMAGLRAAIDADDRPAVAWEANA
jgi:RNA polymerase sigma-70 factor (ECF subfamily)